MGVQVDVEDDHDAAGNIEMDEKEGKEGPSGQYAVRSSQGSTSETIYGGTGTKRRAASKMSIAMKRSQPIEEYRESLL